MNTSKQTIQNSEILTKCLFSNTFYNKKVFIQKPHQNVCNSRPSILIKEITTLNVESRVAFRRGHLEKWPLLYKCIYFMAE